MPYHVPARPTYDRIQNPQLWGMQSIQIPAHTLPYDGVARFLAAPRLHGGIVLSLSLIPVSDSHSQAIVANVKKICRNIDHPKQLLVEKAGRPRGGLSD